ncbi:hypothetical protein [Actinoallomurus iriomotensis]|uniref:C2H2-type domain-containing protein n=1 Tax=Actinoallomurus iriomotensis TaxID=478107 RepID=A0A9W6W1R9_9ACTN|nr:hypothetical protein [Actinoallomurus iriomotensis]GLY88205.1 hypothetical protein Airi02_061340 [Actinoallomurus iriomotensis]
MTSFCRSLARRTSRAYHIVCARDDAASHRFAVPEGVWVCDECDVVLLDAADVSRHRPHVL